MRSTIPVLSAATAVLALVTVASCTATAGAEPTPDPTPPALLLAAEPGPACGTVRMDYLATAHPLEVYRAVTKEPVAGEDVLDWIRQPRDPISRIDTIIPSGYSVTYRVLIAGGESYYSEPVVTEECPEPTPDPDRGPLDAIDQSDALAVAVLILGPGAFCLGWICCALLARARDEGL